MHNRKIAKKITQILILLLSLLLLTKIISLTLSKYQSSASGNPNIQVAFYVIEKDFSTMTINLDSLFPSDEPYVYTFSISNTNGEKMCETDMEYDLQIRTTTNLPITYELYMNENYNDSGATSIIKSNEIIQDENNTYFRVITTDTQNFTYTQEKTNVYQLVIYFPAEYNTINYQDIIEGIEISVNSRQVI
ncbi:MAG: hypothetical protein ACI4VQ_05620 [Clostridia bacterium]